MIEELELLEIEILNEMLSLYLNEHSLTTKEDRQLCYVASGLISDIIKDKLKEMRGE